MSDSGSFMDRKSYCHSSSKSAASSHDHTIGPSAMHNIATSLILRGPDARDSASRVVCRNSASIMGANRMLLDEQMRAAVGSTIQDSSTNLLFCGSYPSWTCRNNSHNGTVLYSEHITNGYQRSACLISNGQAILPSLQVRIDNLTG